ncbi:MAG: GDSL-type esterase/lipase family protein [Candidatus Sumerlaeia bacterium]|nr:GDSL-type esterase/lipase family protein [Candidatus Sumerlaeia bacterium]
MKPDSDKATVASCSAATASPPSPNRRRNTLHDLGFACIAVFLLLAIGEILLRVAGFRFLPVPILVDKTWGPDQVARMNLANGRDVFRYDPLVFWSMIPGLELDDRTINDRGLANGPITVPKPPGTYRILCMGDSCTAMGSGAYPAVLQRRLDLVVRPDRRFEVINGGVFSYSSLQGLRLFRHRLADVEPNLVTVYYGWNDHYLTTSYPDTALGGSDSPEPLALRLLRPFRLFQLTQKVVHTSQMYWLERRRAGRKLYRVPPDDYRAILTEFVTLSRARGAVPLLFTAPHNHSPGRVPAYYVESGLAESADALILIHHQYNEITREVAARTRAELLDLDRAFNRHNKDDLFVRDGVHPNRHGRHLIVTLLLDHLEKMGIITSGERHRIARESTYDSLMPNILRCRVEFLDTPIRAVAGKPIEIAIRLTNTGDTIWLARPERPHGQVTVSAILYDPAGRFLGEKDRCNLPRDVAPNETVDLRWTVKPVDTPGSYVLEVDPLAEFVCRFNDLDDARTTVPLIVAPAN